MSSSFKIDGKVNKAKLWITDNWLAIDEVTNHMHINNGSAYKTLRSLRIVLNVFSEF